MCGVERSELDEFLMLEPSGNVMDSEDYSFGPKITQVENGSLREEPVDVLAVGARSASYFQQVAATQYIDHNAVNVVGDLEARRCRFHRCRDGGLGRRLRDDC